MPCSCDGYEVSDQRLDTAEANVKHLKEQLCNAQSLIHKLLKHINHIDSVEHRRWGHDSGLDPALRDRALAHIQVLLAHKREEAEADRRALQAELAAAETTARNQQTLLDAHEATLAAAKANAQRLREQLSTQLSDEEILG